MVITKKMLTENRFMILSKEDMLPLKKNMGDPALLKI